MANRNALAARKIVRPLQWLIALLIVTGCSGLSGEPPIVATFQPDAQVEDAGMPAQPPDLTHGAQIFADNCTACHGTTGQGDGDLVLSGQLPNAPPDFTDPATARAQTPTQWFATITNGRLDKLMPPWHDSLTEQERWSVALYTYTMSYQADDVERGQAVWLEQCAPCHGERGAGDGARASEVDALPDLTAPGALVERSDLALYNLLSGDADNIHSFGEALDEAHRWAAVRYARRLSLASTTLTPTDTSTAVPPVSIQDATGDPSVVQITSLIAQVTIVQSELQVAEIVTYRNTSDRVFSGSRIEGTDRVTSVIVPVPAGARIVDTASDPQRYVLSGDSSALIDTEPLLPGEDHLVHIIYTLPYDGSARLEIPLAYALEGTVRLMVQAGSLSVSSEALAAEDAEMMGGVIFEAYSAALSQPAGYVLTAVLTRSTANDVVSTSVPTSLIASVLIALGGVALLGAAVLMYRIRRTPPVPREAEALRGFMVEQIAELDALHEQGKIDPAAYAERRDQLKRRLARLMNPDDTAT